MDLGRSQPSQRYVCGYCGNTVGPTESYYATPLGPEQQRNVFIYICSYCTLPTYFDGEEQVPGAKFGGEVAHLPADVAELYDEARRCMSVSAYTSAVLACRKILMNVAVDKEVEEPGKYFTDYVDALAIYVPPDGKGWLDRIRELGNEGTHEIVAKSKAEAEDGLRFTEMLLRLAYEYPKMADEPADTSLSP